MNQCIENPAGEVASAVPDAPPIPGEGTPGAAKSTAINKGRVLLLEDDPAFSGIVSDYLSESGYSVVAVKNGREGIREVLAGSFAFVLCDLMMPGLPGDMFYRAVSRIRPALCERFIFMTGDGFESGANEFFRKNEAFVLRKPFSMKSLLDAFALAEVRFTFRNLFDAQPEGAEPSATSGADDDIPAALIPHTADSALGGKIARILSRAQTTPGTVVPARLSPELAAAIEPRSCVPAVLLLFLFLLAALGKWYSVATDRGAAAVAERLAFQTEWKTVSLELGKALAVRSKLERAGNVSDSIEAERAKPRWTPVLRSLVPQGDAGIQLLEVQAHGQAKDPGACTIRIRGAAEGAQPRLAADQYRQSVEGKVKALANGQPVTTRMEQLYEVTGKIPGRRQAVFEMVATLGPRDAAEPTKKEGSGK